MLMGKAVSECRGGRQERGSHRSPGFKRRTQMTRRPKALVLVGSGVVLFLAYGILAGGPPDQKKKEEERERKVEEKEVPKAALDALKKLAGGAALTEFSEEIEHGSTFYEGSWKGPHGKVDGLVTADGDLVEIEEAVPGDAVPKAVKAESEKLAGKDAELRFEKKTVVLYEVKFKKGDRRHEVTLTPDGRQHEHEEEEGEHEADD
jgi:hypothetical protein